MLRCLAGAPEPGQRVGEIVVEAGPRRLEGNGPADAVGGGLERARPRRERAEPVPGRGIARVALEELPVDQAGPPEETPAQKAAKEMLTKILENQTKYGTIDPSSAKSAEALGKALGLSVTSTAAQEEPGWWGKMFGKKAQPSATKSTIQFGGVEVASPDSAGVLPPPAAGKTITPDIAAQILQEAGGDKNKAREIAKQRGYKF